MATQKEIVDKILSSYQFDVHRNFGTEYPCDLCGKGGGKNGRTMAAVTLCDDESLLNAYEDDPCQFDIIFLGPECLRKVMTSVRRVLEKNEKDGRPRVLLGPQDHSGGDTQQEPKTWVPEPSVQRRRVLKKNEKDGLPQIGQVTWEDERSVAHVWLDRTWMASIKLSRGDMKQTQFESMVMLVANAAQVENALADYQSACRPNPGGLGTNDTGFNARVLMRAIWPSSKRTRAQ